MMDEYRKANRALWDAWAKIHPAADLYEMASLRAGETTLHTLELEELGDVRGKTMLHLQCHFGRDTLAWAREGAIVTGVDFSREAISTARKLSAELGIRADFVESDVYALPTALAGQFDIVFTSYGVLYWLPDLAGWAGVVDHFLRPGGTFYIAEYHPTANIFDDAPESETLRVRYPYFHTTAPDRLVATDSYADRRQTIPPHEYFLWAHSLGDIVTALIAVGLQIEYLHEFPFTNYPQFPMLTPGADGYWRFPDGQQPIPLMFSIRAQKPEG